jgi:hypothetical protein
MNKQEYLIRIAGDKQEYVVKYLADRGITTTKVATIPIYSIESVYPIDMDSIRKIDGIINVTTNENIGRIATPGPGVIH